MDWYYAYDGQQVGPLSELEFRTAVASGRVGSDTLVWRDGLEEWVAWGNLAAAMGPLPEVPRIDDARRPLDLSKRAASPDIATPGTDIATAAGTHDADTVICTECGRSFPPADTISFGTRTVCAECKPAFLHRVKEGGWVTPPAGELVYAGVWPRFCALFLDTIIIQIPVIGISVLVSLALGIAFDVMIEHPLFEVGVAVPFVIFETYMLLTFGGTPGKLLMRLRVVNADGQPVDFRQAFGRTIFAQILVLIPYVGIPLSIAECLAAAFDPQKRAVHDRLVDTRVVHHLSR